MSTTVRVNGALTGFAREKLATMTAATPLTVSTYRVKGSPGYEPAAYVADRSADEAYLVVEAGTIRWTADGTTPTVTAGTGAGNLAYAGDTLQLVGIDAIRKFQAINEVASNGAKIEVSYYRKG